MSNAMAVEPSSRMLLLCELAGGAADAAALLQLKHVSTTIGVVVLLLVCLWL